MVICLNNFCVFLPAPTSRISKWLPKTGWWSFRKWEFLGWMYEWVEYWQNVCIFSLKRAKSGLEKWLFPWCDRMPSTNSSKRYCNSYWIWNGICQRYLVFFLRWKMCLRASTWWKAKSPPSRPSTTASSAQRSTLSVSVCWPFDFLGAVSSVTPFSFFFTAEKEEQARVMKQITQISTNIRNEMKGEKCPLPVAFLDHSEWIHILQCCKRKWTDLDLHYWTTEFVKRRLVCAFTPNPSTIS